MVMMPHAAKYYVQHHQSGYTHQGEAPNLETKRPLVIVVVVVVIVQQVAWRQQMFASIFDVLDAHAVTKGNGCIFGILDVLLHLACGLVD